MKNWLQRIVMITVAFLTLGLITPSHEIWEALENGQASNGTVDSDYNEVSDDTTSDESISEEDSYTETQENQDVDSILLAAKEQSYIKFGPRIASVIGNEFEHTILPKLEVAIESTLSRLNDESIRYLSITDRPSGKYSEKIFNISNGVTGKDLIRFHVRTEKRPLEGYYYNFHYHTAEDQFVAHHHLGDIYWSKNTPPKWMS